MNLELWHFSITTLVSFSIVGLVIINTNIFAKLNHTPAAYSYIQFQGICILLTILRLAELFAPTEEKLDFNITVQNLIVFLVPLFWFSLTYFAIKEKYLSTLVIMASGVFTVLVILLSFLFKRTLFYYLAPVLLVAGITLMVWKRIRKQELSNVEVSLKSVIKSIGDCTLVLDTKNRIMDANFSFFEEMINGQNPGTYMDFCKLLSGLYIKEIYNMDILEETVNYETEREIMFDLNGEAFLCTFKATPLLNHKMDRIGMIVTFHDISGYRKLLNELEEKKEELILINDKLKDYINVEYMLEEAREKKDISFRIQSSIGQEIMELLSLLEVARIKTGEGSAKELELAIEACRNVIGKIRGSVSELIRS